MSPSGNSSFSTSPLIIPSYMLYDQGQAQATFQSCKMGVPSLILFCLQDHVQSSIISLAEECGWPAVTPDHSY